MKLIRVLVLILFISASIIAIPRVVFDDSLQNWVPPDSQIIHEYKLFLEEFKTDALIISAIVDSGDDDGNSALLLDSLKKQISTINHVTQVGIWPPPFIKWKKQIPPNIHTLYITFLPPSPLNPNRPDLVQDLTDLLDSYQLDYHIAGTGVIHKAINEMTGRAAVRYLIIAVLLLFLLLLLVIRDIRVVFKTLGISIGSVTWILIAAWLLEVRFNTIMSILPCLILFYSTSVAIHVVNHESDIRRVFIPTLVAVITTCAGFSAFLLDPSPLLHDFGLLAIIGLLGGLFWALILFYPGDFGQQKELPFKSSLGYLKRFWRYRSLILGSLLFIFFIAGTFRIRSEINILSVLPDENRAVQDYQFIEENVGPYVPMEYLVDISKTKPEELNQWIQSVYKTDKIGAVMSYLAFPPFMNPQQTGYISQDGKTGRIVFFVPVMSTSEGLRLVHQIDGLAGQYFGDSSPLPKPTGYVSLYVSVADHLSKSFRQSLLLAFAFVFVLILLFLRNIKLFLVSILPNLFPVIAILGIMGWFDIPLDMVTVPIGCLALGIIVDDTIHLLYWYHRSGSMDSAFNEAGPGAIFTSVIFMLGFSLFLFSSVNPVRYFGILFITSIATALFADIVILPILLKRGK